MVALGQLLKVWSTDHRIIPGACHKAASRVSPTPEESDTLDKKSGDLHFNKFSKMLVDDTTHFANFYVGGD